jgi:hypothetical protein
VDALMYMCGERKMQGVFPVGSPGVLPVLHKT